MRERERERERDRPRDYLSHDLDADRPTSSRHDARTGEHGTRPPSGRPPAHLRTAATNGKAEPVMSAREISELEDKKRREEAEYKRRVEEQVEMMEEDDEEREQRLIEERRRRRAEIAAKFKAQQSAAGAEVAPKAVAVQDTTHKVASCASAAASTEVGSAPAPLTGGGAAAEPNAEPSTLAVPPSGDDVPPDTMPVEQGGEVESESEEGPPRAPLRRTPSSELTVEERKKETELRAFMLAHRRQFEGGAAPRAQGERGAEGKGSAPADAAQTADIEKMDDGGFDMFNDDVEAVANPEAQLDEAAAMDRGDNYDDKEGYFAHRVGDLLNDRYKVRRDTSTLALSRPPTPRQYLAAAPRISAFNKQAGPYRRHLDRPLQLMCVQTARRSRTLGALAARVLAVVAPHNRNPRSSSCAALRWPASASHV